MVKNLSASARNVVWSLGWEDPLEKEMATQSSILARNTPWTEEPGTIVHGVTSVRQNIMTKPPPRFIPDVEAETLILWAPDVKSWLIWKDPDAGKDWGQKEKGTTEDEMVGWHHWHNGHEFGWTPAVGDGQGGLACSWGRKESDTTERLNWVSLEL